MNRHRFQLLSHVPPYFNFMKFKVLMQSGSIYMNDPWIMRGVARHNFKRRQLSLQFPKTGVRRFYPRIFFEVCIAKESFGKFLENVNKPSSPLAKTGVRGIIHEKNFEICIAVRELWYIFGERKQNSVSPKIGVWALGHCHRKFFLNSALL